MNTAKFRQYAWLLLLLVAVGGCNKRSGLQIDDNVPTVKLNDFHGKSVNLPQDLQGKTVLLHFWSVECECCDQDVIFGLEDLYQKYKDRGFVPVAVNVNPIEAGDERLKQFERLTYPLLIDERGLVARKFGVIGLPASFVFDGKGVLREKITGEAHLAEYEKLFTTILH